MKGFVDDITIISANRSEHQEILSFTDGRCREVYLCIRPDKCFSVVFDGKSVAKNSSFDVGGGQTASIREHPTTFLGSTVCHSLQSSKRSASESFLKGFLASLRKLDSTPVRGEYKVWIYKRYMVPSFHFKLAVNDVSFTAIKKANAIATKCIESWLGLSRSIPVAVIHHPAVLDIPILSSFSAKVKISYLSAVTTSKDALINEIASLSSAPSFSAAVCIPESAVDALRLAISSVLEISRNTLLQAVR